MRGETTNTRQSTGYQVMRPSPGPAEIHVVDPDKGISGSGSGTNDQSDTTPHCQRRSVNVLVRAST